MPASRPARLCSGFIIPALLIVSATLVSCRQQKQYKIGVSQCSEDSWRGKLTSELEMATYFYDDVTLSFTSAHDDSELQERQIDSLVESGIDLLIVSPNQQSHLSAAVDRAFDKGIPVVLFDRKTKSDKYTTFLGADNFEIGYMLGEYACGQLDGKGAIVEICGLKDSSPAEERHNGFHAALKKYPGVRVVESDYGDWTGESGREAMERIMERYDGPVDCIMGGNDRMAAASLQAFKERHPQSDPVVLGVDALSGPGEGMVLVRDSVLSASAIYPTHGDELLQLALNILNGKSCYKEYKMASSLVTSSNANILLLQNEELEQRSENLRKLSSKVDATSAVIATQQTLIFVCVAFIFVSLVLIGVIARANRQKQRLAVKLAEQKEMAERSRDELELERDHLVEAQLALMSSGAMAAASADTGADVLSGNEESFRKESEFMQKFNSVVNENMDDADFGVEQIGQQLGYSRVQLYRKVKALTGKSPVELLRSYRLDYAKTLLNDASLSVSEVAYRVGFSSPSYFSKCYKEEFGVSPSVNQ